MNVSLSFTFSLFLQRKTSNFFRLQLFLCCLPKFGCPPVFFLYHSVAFLSLALPRSPTFSFSLQRWIVRRKFTSSALLILTVYATHNRRWDWKRIVGDILDFFWRIFCSSFYAACNIISVWRYFQLCVSRSWFVTKIRYIFRIYMDFWSALQCRATN